MAAVISNTILSTMVTCLSYFIGIRIFQKYNKAWLHPLYTVTVFMICILALSHIDYERYTSGTKVFSLLLGTATVSLAIPLYQQFEVLKKHFFVIVNGALIGTGIGIFSVWILAKLVNLNQHILLSMLSKSITIPVALFVTDEIGGIPSITILFVVISGVFSLVVGPGFLQIIGIRSKIAIGLALGISAQALGVNRAFQMGVKEGAVGSIAMSISALLFALAVPLLALYL